MKNQQCQLYALHHVYMILEHFLTLKGQILCEKKEVWPIEVHGTASISKIEKCNVL